MSRVLPYGRQSIDEDDIEAVTRVLRSDFLTTGPEIDAFEAELAARLEAKHAVVVSNGTSALHCAYAALGLGHGDVLLTTPYTFSATANMALALSAKVHFVDIDPHTRCISLSALRAALATGVRPKVIAAVDFAGHPSVTAELLELANSVGAKLVQDAAHSLGSRLNGQSIGALSHLTTLSFHPVKTITSGEGGAVVTNDSDLARRCREFRNHGVVRDAERFTTPASDRGPWLYEIHSLGFNYRLSALQCALGRSQLRKLSSFVTRRAEIVSRYDSALPNLRTVRPLPGAEVAWHLYQITVPSDRRRQIVEALAARGVGTQVHYVPVNSLQAYRELGYSPTDTPVTLQVSQETISLPLFPAMLDEDVEHVIRSVREVVG